MLISFKIFESGRYQFSRTSFPCLNTLSAQARLRAGIVYTLLILTAHIRADGTYVNAVRNAVDVIQWKKKLQEFADFFDSNNMFIYISQFFRNVAYAIYFSFTLYCHTWKNWKIFSVSPSQIFFLFCRVKLMRFATFAF